MIENIHIVKSQSFQTLIQAGNDIFLASPVTVRAIPHKITGFGADQDLIPVDVKFFLHDPAKVGLCAAWLRTVVIRKIKMRDSMIKCGKAQGFHVFINSSASKIVP